MILGSTWSFSIRCRTASLGTCIRSILWYGSAIFESSVERVVLVPEISEMGLDRLLPKESMTLNGFETCEAAALTVNRFLAKSSMSAGPSFFLCRNSSSILCSSSLSCSMYTELSSLSVISAVSSPVALVKSCNAFANLMHWSELGKSRSLVPCEFSSKSFTLKADISSIADFTSSRSSLQMTLALQSEGFASTFIKPFFPMTTFISF
mmetsp:Transcript_67679/g.102019  ORF Transcript_67679/g.102019 Transcript_67679/m.102019 type:complete len:208 (-) Transcript_67679:216-839(-)